MLITKTKPRSWQGANFGTHSASYGVTELPQARIIRTSHGWYAYIGTTKLFGQTKAELEAELINHTGVLIMSKFKHYSPKELALAKWNNEQRPKYMEKIERDVKRGFMLRRVEDMEARAEIRVTMTRLSSKAV